MGLGCGVGLWPTAIVTRACANTYVCAALSACAQPRGVPGRDSNPRPSGPRDPSHRPSKGDTTASGYAPRKRHALRFLPRPGNASPRGAPWGLWFFLPDVIRAAPGGELRLPATFARRRCRRPPSCFAGAHAGPGGGGGGRFGAGGSADDVGRPLRPPAAAGPGAAVRALPVALRLSGGPRSSGCGDLQARGRNASLHPGNGRQRPPPSREETERGAAVAGRGRGGAAAVGQPRVRARSGFGG